MGFEVEKADFFEQLQCFVRFRPRNTVMLKFREF